MQPESFVRTYQKKARRTYESWITGRGNGGRRCAHAAIKVVHFRSRFGESCAKMKVLLSLWSTFQAGVKKLAGQFFTCYDLIVVRYCRTLHVKRFYIFLFSIIYLRGEIISVEIKSLFLQSYEVLLTFL